MSEQVLQDYAAERAARTTAPRTFQFEGETFIYRPAIPAETLVTFVDRDGLTARQVLELCDATALACLEPESADAWTSIRSSAHQPPLDFASVIWLTDQLVTRASGLPTERPADSPAGPPEPTSTTSTAASPSTEETPTG